MTDEEIVISAKAVAEFYKNRDEIDIQCFIDGVWRSVSVHFVDEHCCRLDIYKFRIKPEKTVPLDRSDFKVGKLYQIKFESANYGNTICNIVSFNDCSISVCFNGFLLIRLGYSDLTSEDYTLYCDGVEIPTSKKA